MKLFRNFFIPSILLIVAIALAAGCAKTNYTTTSSTGTSESTNQEKIAPDFTARTIAGDTIIFSSLKGKPVVLNFAASWCYYCEVEAPVLEQMYEKYKPQDVFFLGMAVKDAEEDQRAFAQKHGLTFPIGLDPDGQISYQYLRAGHIGEGAIPMTFFITPDGKIASVFIGPLTEALFDQRVKAILPDGAGATPAPSSIPAPSS